MKTLRYYPQKEGLERWLGPLECLVMTYLWACPYGHTSRQVYARCNGGRKQTTIQTTIHRLMLKGMLVMDNSYPARYSPAEPRDVWETRMIELVRRSLDE